VAFETATPSDAPKDVWTALPDGSDPVNVTAHPDDDRSAQWTERGDRLLFLSNRDRAHGVTVWTTGPRGESPRNVTGGLPPEGGDELAARWSPDGHQIAVAKATSVWIVSADGVIATKLSDHTANGLSFSRDGARLIYEANGDIFSVLTVGGPVVNLTRSTEREGSAAYSRDGGRIAFTRVVGSAFDIFTMSPDGSNPVNVTNTVGLSDNDPVWGPDGSLYFASNREGAYKVYRIPPGGGAAVRLTDNDETGGVVAGDWPTGVSIEDRVAFTRRLRYGVTFGTVSIDGSDVHLFPSYAATAGNFSCEVAP
jgi:Tol biopolymer transport system component